MLFIKPNFVFSIVILLIFSANVFAQREDSQTRTIIDYINARLAKANKKVASGGKIYEAKLSFGDLCPVYSSSKQLQRVAERVFTEYGAMFVGENASLAGFELVQIGSKFSLVSQCIFLDELGVNRYQSAIKIRKENIGGTSVELEENAMQALLDARREAAALNIAISPRGGSEAARRSYADTKRLWDSRFYPALKYWVGRNKIPKNVADQVAKLRPIEQTAAVLDWEDKLQAYFSKDMKKSILYSVAAPGASQHIFMLAIDIEQYARKEVRDILAKHGWFQTVKSDMPHFTYLGISDREELKKRGLKREVVGGAEFWTPRIE